MWTHKRKFEEIFLGKRNSAPKLAFQVVQNDFSLEISLAIDLRPASSKLNQKVNFCVLTARPYIRLCETNELTLTLYGYLKYVTSIDKIHVHETGANQSLPKEWTFLIGI